MNRQENAEYVYSRILFKPESEGNPDFTTIWMTLRAMLSESEIGRKDKYYRDPTYKLNLKQTSS